MTDSVTVTLDVLAAQEMASSIRTVVNKIDWVLNNNPPKRNGEAEALDLRAKLLTIAATQVEGALHARAKGAGK